MDVTPWLESANWIGGGMSEFIKGEHMANPRVFKSHLPYSVSVWACGATKQPQCPSGIQHIALLCHRVAACSCCRMT